jgi:hypothetical protein
MRAVAFAWSEILKYSRKRKEPVGWSEGSKLAKRETILAYLVYRIDRHSILKKFLDRTKATFFGSLHKLSQPKTVKLKNW